METNPEIVFPEKQNPLESEIYLASQWELIWRRFKRHKLAIAGLVILIIIYTMAIFCGFFSPYSPYLYNADYINAPPQTLQFFDQDGFHFRPFVYGYEVSRDPETFRMEYQIDHSKKYPVYFLVRGDRYKLLGIWETDLHLFGVKEGHIFLLGADPMGRDLLSRVLYGARISTSIGFIGVFLSFVLGIGFGGISGLYGGAIDNLIQRMIEFIKSIPSIPLWMGLAAALPQDWTVIQVYFAITIILSLKGWTGLAREVRSKFMSLREEDFILSARLIGASKTRIITQHMIPSFLSHIIAQVTLAIPGMILGETSLSFLGLGIRPPAISWGSLLQAAQNVRTVALTPWLLLPGVFVIITVLAFNFLGDGLRDAADPYGK
ncbi:MAG: ABC transporter permease [Halanaerobiales bacterium]|nr:ABC transporter permease [Halanaerobiales bacterium]